MSEFDLGSYLAGQASEGALDSQGEFSVDADKAARKLARFALPNEFSWVLKVVQAAVAWKARELQVQQSKTTTSFLLAMEAESVPTPQMVVETILSGRLDQQQPLQMLCIALRALVEQGGLSFVLGLRQGDSEVETIYAGADVSALDAQQRSNLGQIAASGVRLTVSHQLDGEYYLGRYLPKMMLAQRRDLAIASELIESCWVSPIPLKLDGRYLNGHLEHPTMGFKGLSRPLFAIGLSGLAEVPDLEMRGPFMTRDFPLFESQSQAIAKCQNETAQGWCLWNSSQPILRVKGFLTSREDLRYELDQDGFKKKRRSRLYWVKKGVIVESQPLGFQSYENQITILANADGLETDLTGLSLLNSEEKQRRAGRYIEVAQAALQDRLTRLAELIYFECQLTDEELAEAKSAERRSDFFKAALALPLVKLSPVIAAGAVAGGLLLKGVKAKFPDVNNRAQVEEDYIEELREDMETFIGMRLKSKTSVESESKKGTLP